MSGFWTGGATAYERALARQHAEQRTALDESRARCSDATERDAIAAEISRLRADYQRRLAEIGALLF